MAYPRVTPILLLVVLLVSACGGDVFTVPAHDGPSPATALVQSPATLSPVATPMPATTATSPLTDTSPLTSTSPLTDTSPLTPTIPLRVKGYTLQVELATTSETRARGLMFRESMPENQGMLFVYPYERQLSFWMRNTYIPLSIAFLDATGRILNIEDMQPLDETSHYSLGAARYALEVNQGWFAERGIGVGDVCQFQLPANLIVQ